uniref:t-SNARE coiled-coil homology domain-containing protein n=1 Tax=Macrostomum lignano TaxID=282301 RepID=A0A1I8HJK3_9PLAT
VDRLSAGVHCGTADQHELELQGTLLRLAGCNSNSLTIEMILASALNSLRQTRSHLDSMSNDINRFLTEQRLSSVSYSPDSLADQQRSAYAARSRSISPSYYGGDHQSATRHRLGAPLSSGYDNSASNVGRTPTRVYRYPTDPNLAMSKPRHDAPPTPPPAATFQEIELIQLKRENAELNNNFDYVKQQLDESQAILKRQQELLDEMDEDRKASAPGARQRHLPESAARRRGVAAFRSRSLTPDSGQRGAALSSAGGSEIGDSMQQLIADGRQKDATIRSLSGQVGSLLAERDERSANQAHVRDGLLDLEADLDRLADLPEAANLQHELQPLMEKPQQQPQGMPMGAPVEQQPQQQPQGMPMGAPVEQQPQQQPQGMPMGAPVEQQPQQQPQGMPMGAPVEQQPQQQPQ